MGFKNLVVENIVVDAIEAHDLGRLFLALGQLTGSVSVTAEVAAVQTASSEPPLLNRPPFSSLPRQTRPLAAAARWAISALRPFGLTGLRPHVECSLIPLACILPMIRSNHSNSSLPREGSNDSHDKSPIRATLNSARLKMAISRSICSNERSTG